MIIRRKIGEVEYEANLEGHAMLDGKVALQGVVIVHDPDGAGGRRRAWIQPDGAELIKGYVVICKIALK